MIKHCLEITNNRYTSPPVKPSLLARLWPSFYCYWNLTWIVFGASRKGKAGKYPDDVWIFDSLKIVRLLEQLGMEINYEGFENLESLNGPCVFVCNHMSVMETFILPVSILPYSKVTYVIKESLLTYPVFKHVMISRNPIAVTRTNPRQDLKTMMTEGVDRLKKDISIIVFPQTTRSTGFDPDQFGSIGTKLAKKAGVPIVPVAVKTDGWGNGKYSKDFGKISPEIPVNVAFGKPLQITNKGNEEHQQIVDFICKKLEEWGAKTGD